jgi:hypothetical protein
MNAGELRKFLEKHPDSTEVFVLSDAEGNDIRPLGMAILDDESSAAFTNEQGYVIQLWPED